MLNTETLSPAAVGQNDLRERRKRRVEHREMRRSTRLRASAPIVATGRKTTVRSERENDRSGSLPNRTNTDGNLNGGNRDRAAVAVANDRSMEARDINRQITTDNTERNLSSGQNVPSNSLNNVIAQNEIAYNKIKADLHEALREKRIHLLSLSQYQERNKFLEKELYQLRQDNTALEVMMKKSRRGKKETNPIWSSDNLNGTPLASYQGICLAAAEEAKREATFITTESYCDELHDGARKRNWTGSVVLVSSETAKTAQVYVKLPDSSFGIVKVPMVLARESGYFISPFDNVKGFVRSCVKRILDGPVGAKMSENEKVNCVASISAHKQTTQRFKSILMDNFGNRKKASLGLYLRTLGYKDGAKTRSGKHSDQDIINRKHDRELAYEKCYVELNSIQIANTMHWRVAEFDELCNSTISSSPVSDTEEHEELSDQDIVDSLFMNKAAKRTFQHFRGYVFPKNNHVEESDATILTLARADACMTTMMKWITNDGKGGTRNTSYHAFYTRLVPIAMDNIIKEIWNDLEALVPHEMRPFIDESEANTIDPFGNIRREWTVVLKHPVDSYIYLLASPLYFRSKICSWYGTVKDCYIGRCGSKDDPFTRINSSMNFEQLEESDLEDDVLGSSQSQEGT